MRKEGGISQMVRVLAFLIFVSFLGTWSLEANGATIKASSCSRESVSSAYNAASPGDTVQIPSCPSGVTWTGGIVDRKGVTFNGAGIDSTVIDDQSSWALIELLNSGTSKVMNMTINQNSSKSGDRSIGMYGNEVRIAFIKFTNLRQGKRGIWTTGAVRGVIDNNIFTWTSGAQPILVEDGRTPVPPDIPGNTAWSSPMQWGGADLIYIENNTFNATTAADGVDCDQGGSYVFRYNTVYNMVVGNHGCDSVSRGCKQMEIYYNNFYTTDGQSPYYGIQSRGGTAVIYNNTMTGSWGMPLSVTNYRSQANAWPYCSGCMMAKQPRCDGTSSIDGNTGLHGYPCRDQIGRGTDQTLYPVYEWNNTYNGSNLNIVVLHNYGGNPDYLNEHVVSGRDFYPDTRMPGYTPYQYPHPLRGGNLPDSKEPAPPTRLRIVPQ
jgi:hypothetical protein